LELVQCARTIAHVEDPDHPRHPLPEPIRKRAPDTTQPQGSHREATGKPQGSMSSGRQGRLRPAIALRGQGLSLLVLSQEEGAPLSMEPEEKYRRGRSCLVCGPIVLFIFVCFVLCLCLCLTLSPLSIPMGHEICMSRQRRSQWAIRDRLAFRPLVLGPAHAMKLDEHLPQVVGAVDDGPPLLVDTSKNAQSIRAP
jgi:hypothetical protein